MPRHLSPPRLKDRCVASIALNIDFWCSHVARGFIDEGIVRRYVVGPFEYLTSELIENIIQASLNRKKLKLQHLELLLQTRVHRLDLSLCNKALSINDSFFSTVGFRLTSLRNLCLDMCKKVTPQCLVDVLSQMPHIQTLSLSWTNANDTVVVAVCRGCPALRELFLQGCGGVTDVSVDALVGSRRDNPVDNDVVVGDILRQPCPQLTSLNVSETRVSTKGLRRILKQISNLRHFYHEDGVFALCEDDNNSYQFSSYVHPVMQTLTQTGLSFENIDMKYPKLNAVFDSFHANCFVESFPHLQSLVLHTNLCDKAVLCLSQLQCLKSLDVYDCSYSLTFADGILPLLSARGKSLTELALHELDEVDLLAILGLCDESLTSLFCLGIASFTDSYSSLGKVKNQNCSLKKLHVLPFGENNLSSANLQKVLRICSQITNVHFNNIQVIEDSLLGAVLLSNPLESLSEVCFTDCNAINADFVISLLNRDSDLSHLKLVDCEGVYPDDFKEFVNCIVENNFDTWLEIQCQLLLLSYPPR